MEKDQTKQVPTLYQSVQMQLQEFQGPKQLNSKNGTGAFSFATQNRSVSLSPMEYFFRSNSSPIGPIRLAVNKKKSNQHLKVTREIRQPRIQPLQKQISVSQVGLPPIDSHQIKLPVRLKKPPLPADQNLEQIQVIAEDQSVQEKKQITSPARPPLPFQYTLQGKSSSQKLLRIDGQNPNSPKVVLCDQHYSSNEMSFQQKPQEIEPQTIKKDLNLEINSIKPPKYSEKMKRIQHMMSVLTYNPKKIEKILLRRLRKQRKFQFKPSDENTGETLRGPKCVSQIISKPLESIEKIEEAQNQIKKEKEMVLPAVSVADVHTQLQRSPLYEIVQQIYNKTETENILPFKNAGSEAKSLEFLLTQIVTGKFNYDMSHAANEQLLCKHADIIELVKRNRTESFEEVVSQSDNQIVSHDDLFEFKILKEQEQKLATLFNQDLADLRQRESQNITFMTQNLKPDQENAQNEEYDDLDLDTDIRQHRMLKRLQQIESSQDILMKERVTISRNLKQKIIQELLQETNQVVKEPQFDKQDRKDLVYWSFIETVRQIAISNREHAALLLRSWHAYQAFQANQIQDKFNQT